MYGIWPLPPSVGVIGDGLPEAGVNDGDGLTATRSMHSLPLEDNGKSVGGYGAGGRVAEGRKG